jgi:predicted metal-dependent peptidase
VTSQLSDFFVYLLMRQSFWGRFASSIGRVSTSRVSTLAVGMRDNRITLFYNPNFLDGMSFKAAAFVLIHELMHVVLDHIPRYLELLATLPTDKERLRTAPVYNIAMDATVNWLIRGHEGFVEANKHTDKRVMEAVKARDPTASPHPSDGMVMPAKWGLPENGSFEDYLHVLMRRVQVIEIAVQLQGGSDHSQWVEQGDGESAGAGEGEGGGQDFRLDGPLPSGTADDLLSQATRAREHLKRTLRSVVRSHGGLGRGTLPGDIEEWLEVYLADPIVPWWEVFATRARMSRSSKMRRSIAMPNRVLLGLAEEDARIIPVPGRRRDKSWRVFLFVDTSGSMATRSLEIVQSELHHMRSVDEDMEIRYMQGDSEVHLDVVLKTGDEIPKGMYGRGGTCFNTYFQHMQQYVKDEDKTPDIVVVYTDGYAPPVTPDNRLPMEIPVIWLVTPDHSEHFADGYGEIIVCDDSHNDRYKGS